ncbi:MAG: TIGR04076 family protein [Chloroflexi bacterium]|nr:TIGR04076 family protein [Chloroflexota bacterium]
MPKCKITVLKKAFDQDLADEYCLPTSPCSKFTKGQEFIVERGERPEDFCDWAWNDLNKVWVALRHRGDFGGWMKNEKSLVECCTDGIRPVVFKLEYIE